MIPEDDMKTVHTNLVNQLRSIEKDGRTMRTIINILTILAVPSIVLGVYLFSTSDNGHGLGLVAFFVIILAAYPFHRKHMKWRDKKIRSIKLRIEEIGKYAYRTRKDDSYT